MAAVLVLLSCQRKSEGVFRVADLQVEYMETPLGIDVEAPRFSWKMVSAKYDQRQEAYRITVKETGKGTLVYDSDRCVSDVSVGVVYRGEALKPCTRYEWTVEVWNQNGRVGRASSWFETGLMGSGWSGARWISSGQPHFSRYRSRYQIDFDLQCNGKNPEPVFIFGRKDERNFVQLNLTPRSAVLSHTTEGVAKKDWEAPLKQLPSHVGIRVVAHDYAKGYKIWLIADGTPVNKEPVEIRPYPESVWKPDCRFHGVGFAQRNPDPSGDEAVFSHFTVTEDVWNTTLYKSDRVVKVVSDTEEYFNPADESGAPMLRKSFEVRKNLVSLHHGPRHLRIRDQRRAYGRRLVQPRLDGLPLPYPLQHLRHYPAAEKGREWHRRDAGRRLVQRLHGLCHRLARPIRYGAFPAGEDRADLWRRFPRRHRLRRQLAVLERGSDHQRQLPERRRLRRQPGVGRLERIRLQR